MLAGHRSANCAQPVLDAASFVDIHSGMKTGHESANVQDFQSGRPINISVMPSLFGC